MTSRTLPERAALAFSVLSPRAAESVARHLSLADRARVREPLARIGDAGDDERHAALRSFTAAVCAPVVFPVPAVHDEATCGFRALEPFGSDHIARALARIATQDPLSVAVALCHLSVEDRDEVWDAIPGAARAVVRNALPRVSIVTHARTRRFAQELRTAVERAAKGR